MPSRLLRPIHVRDIRADDKQVLIDGLARLSQESIHARFLSPKPRLSSRELRYLTEVDGIDHVALMAFDDHGGFLGVARFIRDREDPTVAEVGIVVGDGVQGQGIGTHLGLLLADRGRAAGIERFSAIMLPENKAALALFGRISARLHSQLHDGVRELVAELRAA